MYLSVTYLLKKRGKIIFLRQNIRGKCANNVFTTLTLMSIFCMTRGNDLKYA